MALMLHFMEFKTREGLMCLQRADQISTILESTLPAKGDQPAQTILYLLLDNKNRIEVVGETRDSILRKFYSVTGTLPLVILRHEPPEPETTPIEAVVAEAGIKIVA